MTRYNKEREIDKMTWSTSFIIRKKKWSKKKSKLKEQKKEEEKHFWKRQSSNQIKSK
jgi:hypothetical protein